MTIVDVQADPRLLAERKFFLGRTAGGDRVWMFVRIEDSKSGTTIHHEEIETTLRYSFTFELIELGRRTVSSAGCGIEWSVRAVTLPGKGLAISDLKRLAHFAERWHLNDMRAGCAHMPATKGSYDDHRHDVCSEGTDYRFGMGWLIEEVPTEDVIEIEHILSKIPQ